ncbi:unnamed protein product [Calypogeia fissa]
MARILHALKSVQDAVNSLVPAPTASPEPVLPELKKLNDSVYELCRPSGSQNGRPSIEVVFFHGLQFDGSKRTYLTTWLSEDGQESWLPWIFECFPEARILLVSYNEGNADMYITSENLVQDLLDHRARVGQDGCPVVLVGHSLGGLVIKEILLKASSMLNLDPWNETVTFFLENVKQVFYYSCPHNGTRLADIKSKFIRGPLFKHLTTLNKEVARCNEEFHKLRRKSKWRAHSIAEQLPTNLGQLGRHIVVEEASARHDTDVYYSAHADHVTVCRPKSMMDARFSKLKDALNQALVEDIKGHKVRISYDDVVGLDDQVKMVRQKLEHSRQVGLFGLGGIGKSTLAELVYDTMSDNFEYSSFVSGVKESVMENASLEDLRAEILRNLYYKGHQVSVKWSRLKGKRILIVLDDVKYESQVLDLKEANGFSTESCLLLTSRDQRILRLKDFEVYSVQVLDDEASKVLFCNHAFKTAIVPEAYRYRVEKFTRKCGGWPLALEVAGIYLYNQKHGAVWDGAFQKLSQAKPLHGRTDEDKLWPIFKTIYDSLATEEQQMFLDVAVCFHDEELESVKRTWRVCSSESTDAGWQNLLDMGLVTTTITTGKHYYHGLQYPIPITTITMHEVLRDLGHSIACPDPRNIQGHSHVCYHIDTDPWPFEQGSPEVKMLKVVSYGGQNHPRFGMRCTIDIGKLHGLENLKALWLDGVNLRGECNLFPAKLEFLKVKTSSQPRYDVKDDDSSGDYFCGLFGVVGQLFQAVSWKLRGWYCMMRMPFSQPHPTLKHLEIERGRDLAPHRYSWAA